MELMNILLDNVNASRFDLCVVDRPSIPTTEREIVQTSIRGMDGDLIEKFSYKDVTIDIELNFLEENKVFKQSFFNIKRWLLNAKKLSFTDDVGYYRKIKNVMIAEAENDIEEYGIFTVTFLVDPFYYLENESAITFLKAFELRNIGTYKSFPEIEIIGSGDIELIVNGVTYHLLGVTKQIILDSDVMHAYAIENGTIVGKNHLMTTPKFPIFTEGTNSVSWVGKVTKVNVRPRWRKI